MSSEPSPLAPKLAAAFGALSLALLAACIVLARGRSESAPTELSPEERARVLAQLASQAKVIFDSHPDPEVGRVLLPNLEGLEFSGVPVHTNRFGLRERDYALPKPEGVTRVVLLGDSFVFGYGVLEHERHGVHLERFLEERAQVDPDALEVLHIGVGSWGMVEECEFVRRQLSELQPDLVLHLVVTNDLDDNTGVRGQGVRSSFSPRHRERADSLVLQTFPRRYEERGGQSTFLLEDVDHESRERHELAARRVGRLREAVESVGGRYVFLPLWSNYKPRLMRHFWDVLPAECVAPLANDYYFERAHWVSETDPHWNGPGHEHYARFLYGLIRARDLLPALELEPWAEADAQYASDAPLGLEEARREPVHGWGPGRRVSPFLDFAQLTPELYAQVYGGLDADGLAAPYASLVLLNFPDARLVARVECLERPELDGGRVRVWVEEFELGSFELRAGAGETLELPLPDELDERGWVNVRFEADDWIYTGPERRNCRSWRLRAVALMPPD